MFSKRRRYQRELLPVVQAKLEHKKVVVLQNQVSVFFVLPFSICILLNAVFTFDDAFKI